MKTRREAREWAVQFLFQRDFNPEEQAAALEDFWAEKSPSPRARAFMEELVSGVMSHRQDIDEHIQRYAENWDLQRIGALDRNVLRLALYEMLYRPDIPPVVSINEAVDIAKEYSGRESGRFVNGILDRVRKELHRPARTPLKTPSEEQEV